MNFVITLLGILATLLIVTYYSWAMVEKYLDYRSKRFSSNKAEFMSDLVKLQHKYYKRGCWKFAKSLGVIAEGFNLPPEEIEPDTEYGKGVIRDLKMVNAENDEEV